MAQKFTVPITVKQLTTAGSDAVTVYVDADTYARLKLEAGGRLVWGSGSATGDVTLYRESADVLKTDDDFKVAGKLSVTASSGDEGGEIFLAQAQTNTTLSGGITIDSYQNKIRFFEQGGSARGAYIDLTAAASGAGTNLLAGGGGATNLDGLTDVAITSPEKYQTVVYDGTTWINEFPTTVSLVNNAETTTLNVGEVVYLYGNVGNRASVKRASNTSDSTSAKTVGMVAASIPAGGNGPVVTRGYVTGMDLSVGYTAGQTVYLSSTAGQFTTTKPYAPNHLVYVGVIARTTSNGIIYVATQNGYELDEIHDVDLITTPPTSGQFLKYNGTLWVNDTIDLGTDTNGNYMSGVTAGTGITVTHTPGEGSTATIANAGVTSVNGSTGAITGVVTTSSSDTLSNKSIALGSNTITGTKAQFDTAVTDDNFAYLGASQTFTNNMTVSTTSAGSVLSVTNAGAGNSITASGPVGVTGSTTVRAASTQDGVILQGRAGGTASYAVTLTPTTLSASRTLTLPDTAGTVVTTGDTGTVTSTMIANNTIVNADINTAAAIDLTKLSTTGASSGYVISYNGTAWAASQLSNNSYNLDGGVASSTYGGITSLNGGTA